jgi:hypothetical protein
VDRETNEEARIFFLQRIIFVPGKDEEIDGITFDNLTSLHLH